ncbi:hypothetical protein Tco_0173602 [Tanacetum coccineum]
MGYLIRAYYNISSTKYYKDDSCWSADLKSNTTEDIISIGSFMEVLVLNHYVLVRKLFVQLSLSQVLMHKVAIGGSLDVQDFYSYEDWLVGAITIRYLDSLMGFGRPRLEGLFLKKFVCHFLGVLIDVNLILLGTIG